MARVKEENYFDMFAVSVDFSCEIANKFMELVENYTDVENKVVKIHDIEHRADQHFHKIFSQLSKSFITPIEREDILVLSQSTDNLTDAIEGLAFCFYMLNITELRDDVKPFAALIIKSCDHLRSALIEFKQFKKSHDISQKIVDVNNIEEEGDRFYHKAVRRLHEEEKDALTIMKWREIYDKLENCLDACEDVADNLEGIILKNS